MIKSLQQVARERMSEGAKAAFARYRYAVVPVYGGTQFGAPDHIGSGVLLDLPEGHFILTAAHVVDWNEITKLYTGASHLEEMRLEWTKTLPPDGDRARDHYDFALARLPDNFVSRLQGATFITEAEISRSVATTVGRAYTCLGFPNSKNKARPGRVTNLNPVIFPYTGNGVANKRLSSMASEDDHILVDYNFKHSRDENGQRVNSVGFKGCSGGAIIDLGRPLDPETLDKDCEPLLAALVIEGYPNENVIVGVRIFNILLGVRKANWGRGRSG